MNISRLFKKTETVIALILIVVMLIIGFINPAFWRLDNIFSLLKSNIIIGIMALGVTLVMIAGGFDVSFPAFAVAGMYLTVKLMVYTGYQGLILPFIVAILIGLACGTMNGFFVYKYKMIPLIVTLGTASMVKGFILGVVGTSMININKMPPQLINFAKTNIINITNPDGTKYGLTSMILVYILLAVLIHLFLNYTMLGRGVYALGNDKESAKRAGFNVKVIIFTVFCAAGAIAGFAGLLHSSMIWLANPRDFVGMDLEVIAAVVIGGTSIFGGKGSVIGTMLGVFMLVIIKNSLIIMKVETTWQKVVIGLIIIIATAITAWRDKRSKG